MPQSKKGPSTRKHSALEDARAQLVNEQVKKARRGIEDDEDDQDTDRTSSVAMKVCIAVGLVVWIAAMIWFAKSAFKKKDQASNPSVPTFAVMMNG